MWSRRCRFDHGDIDDSFVFLRVLCGKAFDFSSVVKLVTLRQKHKQIVLLGNAYLLTNGICVNKW